MHPDTVLELLRTHCAADSAQLQDIRRKAEYYESELTSWQNRLEAARVLVNVIQEKANDMARKRDIFKSYLSPIHSLPAELLAQILVDASADDPDFEILTNAKSRGAIPQTSHALACVCKFWRNIVLYTPNIWSHYVAIRPGPGGSGIAQAVIVGRQLQHIVDFYGRNLTKLSLQLPKSYRPEWHPIRDLFLQKRNQFKALKLIGDVFAGYPAAVDLAVPALEELLLCADSESFELRSMITFRGPLTKLSIYYPSFALDHLTLPSHQVTYLSFGFPKFSNMHPRGWWPSLVHILQFVQSFSSLTELHLVGIHIAYPTQTLSKLVTLPWLRMFELNDYNCSVAGPVDAATMFGPAVDPPSLLAHLRTPSLERFDWIIPGTFTAPSEATVERVNHFLRNSSRLRMLRVAFCDFDPRPHFCGGHILRLIGTRCEFGALRGIQDFTHKDVLALASHKKYPNEISPHLLVEGHPIASVDYFIDRILEDKKLGPYAPVGRQFEWPNANKATKEGRRRLQRFEQTRRTSEIVFSGLLGEDEGAGPIDCERRLYVTI